MSSEPGGRLELSKFCCVNMMCVGHGHWSAGVFFLLIHGIMYVLYLSCNWFLLWLLLLFLLLCSNSKLRGVVAVKKIWKLFLLLSDEGFWPHAHDWLGMDYGWFSRRWADIFRSSTGGGGGEIVCVHFSVGRG